MKSSRKAQIFSTDVVIATILLILAFTTVIYLVSRSGETASSKELIKDNRMISEVLTKQESTIGFLFNNKIDETKLEEFATKDYEDIKQAMGLESEFCMHFEDEDGNLFVVEGVKVMGNPEASVILTDENGIDQEFFCNGVIKP